MKKKKNRKLFQIIKSKKNQTKIMEMIYLNKIKPKKIKQSSHPVNKSLNKNKSR